jgi:FdhD protein
VKPTRPHACHVCESGAIQPARRELLTEEPLIIELDEQPIVALMRTAGSEVELALGYLRTEGIIQSLSDVKEVSLHGATHPGVNTVRVISAEGPAPRRAVAPYRRVFSSCSVCGLEQIKEIARDIALFPSLPGRLTHEGIVALADRMRLGQTWFPATGASHAAALAPRPLGAASLEEAIVREDVGRHNALDKAVGAAMQGGLDLGHCVLCLSSRLSFEMVAKAARAGIADVVGLSAATTLAVDLAQRLGLFLAGFVRGNAFTVYAGIEAIDQKDKTDHGGPVSDLAGH